MQCPLDEYDDDVDIDIDVDEYDADIYPMDREDYGSSRGDGRSDFKRRRSDFIDDVAEEDDEGYGGRSRYRGVKASNAEEEGEEGGEDDLIEKVDLHDVEDSRSLHHRPLLSREVDQEDVEALARINQKWFDRDRTKYNDDDQSPVKQQALLPSVRDPKLWMVKCTIGHEREVAVCLMQKCIDRGSKLQIRSAIALDHLKNYIYIEADKEALVKEACKGMRNVCTRSKFLFVPLKEMTYLLSHECKHDISRDTWVRMKMGIYKGDLGKVVDVYNVMQRAVVKLIPRIDLQALANELEGREVPKETITPLPCFMNVDEARAMNIRVERRRDPLIGDYCEVIDGMLFKDGFLYKTVSTESISTQNIQLSYDELKKFQKRNENAGGGIASLSTHTENIKRGPFMKGDRVIVIKGDLKNLEGSVEKVEEGTVHIKPNAIGPGTLAVNEKELWKYFEPGSHVKVVSGAQKGMTGVVVTVQGNVVSLVSDTTKEVVRVFCDRLVETCDVATDITRRLPNSPPSK